MKRFEVWLSRLDPAEGSEMRKTRPVVIASPEEMNAPPLDARCFKKVFRSTAKGPSAWRENTRG